MNVIARLEYELAYYDSADHIFNHYTTRTLPWLFVLAVDVGQQLRLTLFKSYKYKIRFLNTSGDRWKSYEPFSSSIYIYMCVCVCVCVWLENRVWMEIGIRMYGQMRSGSNLLILELKSSELYCSTFCFSWKEDVYVGFTLRINDFKDVWMRVTKITYDLKI